MGERRALPWRRLMVRLRSASIFSGLATLTFDAFQKTFVPAREAILSVDV